MKKSVSFSYFICFTIFCFSQNWSQFVNPFIGTGGHGHTFPGATMPFGMVQLSPDTRVDGSWDGCSGYHYSDTVLYGFSHTHLSGTGCSDYGDVLLMPFVWKKEGEIPSSFTAKFSHLSEMASPGYYGVRPENGILSELTVTTRAGFHRYDYGAYQDKGEPQTVSDPENSLSAGVILDLYHRDDLLDFEIISVGKNEVYGYRRSKAWAKNQVVYYWITFSEPIIRYFTLDKNNNTARSGAKMAFDFGKKGEVKVKVGISGVDAKGANKNLVKEIPHWDFEKTKKEAVANWDKELSKIQVEGGTKEQNTVFYTALYHCMIAPNVYSDVDGQYRGRDNKIHSTGGNWDYYTVFSLWDTYRALHPLLTIIDEKRTNHFIRTFIRQYEEGGLLPVWELSANETNCMIGYHSVSVIADAYMKGIRDYDAEKAFAAMKHSAMQDHFGLAAYKKYGYIPSDKEHESVSKTLEYAYDDWCIAQMAQAMGQKADYEYFTKRSQGYLNLYDKETGFFRPRKNGGWLSPFRPSEVNNHYTEGNAYHYSFGNQHDLGDLYMNLTTSDKEFNALLTQKLDSLFYTKQKLTGRDQADVTGLIGQYAHGNEPSHHIPYLYNLAGNPAKTEELLHKITTEFYTSEPTGLIGNEDCGQMSAWYVFSALGFYPVCPGNNEYLLGAPIFPKATIRLANDKQLHISAENLSEENYYVSHVSFNKRPLYHLYAVKEAEKEDNPNKEELQISHFQDIGGELVFYMTNKPFSLSDRNGGMEFHSEWESTAPSTAPLIVSDKKTFRDSLLVTMEGKDIFYTMDGSDPLTKAVNSLKYTTPFYIHQSCTIKAMSEEQTPPPTEAHFYKVNPEFHVTLMNCKPNSQYYADGEQSLIDGVRGDKNWRLGDWMGFQGQDVEIVVDLGRLRKINAISLGCLQDFGSWISMPKEVIFEVAKDGGEFEVVGSVKNDVSDKETENIIKDFRLPLDKYGRRIRITAKNSGVLPSWHPGAGGETFIFVDEVGVE